MNKSDNKKKEMARKMYPNEDTIHTSARQDRNYDRLMNSSSKVYKDFKKLDNVGKTASKKSTIDAPGQKNNSSRKMP